MRIISQYVAKAFLRRLIVLIRIGKKSFENDILNCPKTGRLCIIVTRYKKGAAVVAPLIF